MLNIQRKSPAPTLAEVIEFLQSLPPDMVCTNRLVEFEPREISVMTLDDTSLAKAGTVIQRIELTLEPRR